MIPLQWYLVVAGALFCIGLYGVLARRNAVAVLMGVELMLNAANLNLVAFGRYLGTVAGQIFAIFIITLAAAEVAVGLALILAIYRSRRTIALDEINLMKG